MLPAAVIVCLEVCTRNKPHMYCNSRRQSNSVVINPFAGLAACIEPVVTICKGVAFVVTLLAQVCLLVNAIQSVLC